MKQREYETTTEKNLLGRQARLLRKVNTHVLSIPAGTIVTIERKFGGFDVKAAACKCCGVAVYIKRLQPCDVELL